MAARFSLRQIVAGGIAVTVHSPAGQLGEFRREFETTGPELFLGKRIGIGGKTSSSWEEDGAGIRGIAKARARLYTDRVR